MQCPKCGYEMGPFDVECPRCKRMTSEGKSADPRVPQPTPKPGYVPIPVDTRARAPRAIEPVEIADPPANLGLGFAAFFLCLVTCVIGSLLAGVFATPALVLATCIWMAVDAAVVTRPGDTIGSMPAWLWGLCGILLWIVALPWYLVARDRYVSKHGDYAPLTWLFGSAGIALGVAFLLALALGLGIGLSTLALLQETETDAAALQPAARSVEHDDGRDRCRDNLATYARAAQYYLQDNYFLLPDDTVWVAQLTPYLPEGFNDKSACGARYYMNRNVSGGSIEGIDAPNNRVLFHESDQAGNPVYLHSGTCAVAFVDGHVQFLTPRQLKRCTW